MRSEKLSTRTKRKPLRKKPDVVNVVVFVYHGVIDTVEAYRDFKAAQARAKFFRKDSKPDYDDVGVFEVEIGKRDEV